MHMRRDSTRVYVQHQRDVSSTRCWTQAEDVQYWPGLQVGRHVLSASLVFAFRSVSRTVVQYLAPADFIMRHPDIWGGSEGIPLKFRL